MIKLNNFELYYEMFNMIFVMLGSLFGHVGVTFSSLFGHVGVTCWSCRGHFFRRFWDMLGYVLGYFGNVFGWVWNGFDKNMTGQTYLFFMSGSIFPTSGRSRLTCLGDFRIKHTQTYKI